ncbi:hypothetical protein BIW11_02414 [Tropilaelaps mercedesae]|uniref:Uncharacterized protein n=1 Tax=Tropilaelaps mercedesae TaxID=418985 RepID=A0A1V9Y3M1_9ACAR|nr:hypothetical protein BIW11_02414 [Tropilaelaps mercedesae]
MLVYPVAAVVVAWTASNKVWAFDGLEATKILKVTDPVAIDGNSSEVTDATIGVEESLQAEARQTFDDDPEFSTIRKRSVDW